MLAGKVDQLVPLSDSNSFHCTRLLRLRLLRLRRDAEAAPRSRRCSISMTLLTASSSALRSFSLLSCSHLKCSISFSNSARAEFVCCLSRLARSCKSPLMSRIFGSPLMTQLRQLKPCRQSTRFGLCEPSCRPCPRVCPAADQRTTEPTPSLLSVRRYLLERAESSAINQ